MKAGDFKEIVLFFLNRGFRVEGKKYWQCDLGKIKDHAFYQNAMKRKMFTRQDNWLHMSEGTIEKVLGYDWERVYHDRIYGSKDLNDAAPTFEENLGSAVDDALGESFDGFNQESHLPEQDVDFSNTDALDEFALEDVDSDIMEIANETYNDFSDVSEEGEDSFVESSDESEVSEFVADYHIEALKPLYQIGAGVAGLLLAMVMFFATNLLDLLLFLVVVGILGFLGWSLYRYFKDGYELKDKAISGGFVSVISLLAVIGLFVGASTPVDDVVLPNAKKPAVEVASSVEESKPEVSEETAKYIDTINVTFSNFTDMSVGNTKMAQLPISIENLTDQPLKYHIGIQAYDASGAEIGDMYYVLNVELLPNFRRTVYAYELYRYFDFEKADELAKALSKPDVTFKVMDISTWE